jgi:hypothetical protein
MAISNSRKQLTSFSHVYTVIRHDPEVSLSLSLSFARPAECRLLHHTVRRLPYLDSWLQSCTPSEPHLHGQYSSIDILDTYVPSALLIFSSSCALCINYQPLASTGLTPTSPDHKIATMPKAPKKRSSTQNATPAEPVTLNEALVSEYPDDFVVQYMFAPAAKTPRRMLRYELLIRTRSIVAS